MRNKIIFVLLTLWIAGCSSAGVKKEQAQLHLRIGTAHLMNGQYPLALKELISAEELDPDDAVIQNNLGLAFFVRKEYDLALTHIKKAIQINPKYSDARNNLGRVHLELAQYDSAIAEFTGVVSDLTYPTPEKAYSNLGLTYLKKGQPDKALAPIKKALEANNKFCTAHNLYGQALFQMQKFELALESLDRALSFCNGNFDEAHYYSSLALFKLGQREKAIARLEEVTKLYPASDYASKAHAMLKMMK